MFFPRLPKYSFMFKYTKNLIKLTSKMNIVKIMGCVVVIIVYCVYFTGTTRELCKYRKDVTIS